jgi:hypothetical protein
MRSSVVATTNSRQTLVMMGVTNSHLFGSFLSDSPLFLKLFAKIKIVFSALFSAMRRLDDKYKKPHTNF